MSIALDSTETESRSELGSDTLNPPTLTETRNFNLSIGLDQARKYRAESSVSGLLYDGFKDGGRFVDFDDQGKAIAAQREVIVIDRENDPELRRLISEAKRIQAQGSSPVEAAGQVVQLIAGEINNPQGVLSLQKFEGVDAPRRGEEVLWGEAKADKCRYGAKGVQVLAAEMGMQVTLKRGYVVTEAGAPKAHEWNELTVTDEDGQSKTYVVDVMAATKTGGVTEIGSEQALHYYDAKNKPLYPEQPSETSVQTAEETQLDSIQKYTEETQKGENGKTTLLLRNQQGEEVLRLDNPTVVEELDDKTNVIYQDERYQPEDAKSEFLSTDEAIYRVEKDESGKVLRVTKSLGSQEEVNVPPFASNLTEGQFRRQVDSELSLWEEGSKGMITPDLIANMVAQIAGYRGRSPGVPEDAKRELATEATVRLILAGAERTIQIGQMEQAEAFIRMLGKDYYKFLKEKIWGPEGMHVLKNMEQHDRNDNVTSKGSYWRSDDKERRDAAYKVYIKNNLAKRMAIQARGPMANPTAAELDAAAKRAETVIATLKRTFIFTGMATYYTGPLSEPDRQGHQHLLEEDYMRKAGHVDFAVDVRTNPRLGAGINERAPKISSLDTTHRGVLRDTPDHIIYHDENYWNAKVEYRKGKVGNSDARKQIRFATSSDPATGLRNLQSGPEGIDFLARNRGVALRSPSIRRLAEVYCVTLPQFAGFADLEGFLGDPPPGLTPSQRNLYTAAQRRGQDVTFAYAAMLKGSNEAFKAMQAFLEEPLKTQDPKNLNTTLENFFKAVQSISFVGSRSPTMANFASARLLDETLNWVNGHDKDRWENFSSIPTFGRHTRLDIIRAAASVLGGARGEVAKDQGVTQGKMQERKAREAEGDFLADFVKALFGQLKGK